jgi:hypothetical protein
MSQTQALNIAKQVKNQFSKRSYTALLNKIEYNTTAIKMPNLINVLKDIKSGKIQPSKQGEKLSMVEVNQGVVNDRRAEASAALTLINQIEKVKRLQKEVKKALTIKNQFVSKKIVDKIKFYTKMSFVYSNVETLEDLYNNIMKHFNDGPENQPFTSATLDRKSVV